MRLPLTRLYIPPSFLAPPRFKLSPSQTHKLSSVLRAHVNDPLVCFNEVKGEYKCRLLSPTKGEVEVLEHLRPAPTSPSFTTTLAFSPLKPERTQQLVEAATQLGVSRLIPLQTDLGQKLSTRWSSIKAQEWCIGAAEQCGRFAPPLLEPLTTLSDFLGAYTSSSSGPLLVGDTQESGLALTIRDALQGLHTLRATFLVGPEGGWSAKEMEMLREMESSGGLKRVTLSPLILRAETAAIAALAGINNLVGLLDEKR